MVPVRVPLLGPPDIDDEISETLLASLSRTDGSNLIISTDAPVPEPSTWAMMILGFGAAGSILRRQRRVPA